MESCEIKLSSGKSAIGYCENMGPVNLVFARTDEGMIGCGAFDVAVFDKFSYPAAKLKNSQGRIATVEDLLASEVIEANQAAQAIGISQGMTGKEVLEQL